jgi:hypothetical protein
MVVLACSTARDVLRGAAAHFAAVWHARAAPAATHAVRSLGVATCRAALCSQLMTSLEASVSSAALVSAKMSAHPSGRPYCVLRQRNTPTCDAHQCATL